jgi:tRNA (adenine-N(1)-)-methyltransferase non-catalytic subunit
MFDKAPTGIWNLRPDSLSLLLSMANVAAHSRTLLLDNCQGLLAAACAERMGGHGVLCCVGTGGKAPALSGLRQLNLGQQQRAIVCMAQLTDVQQAAEVGVVDGTVGIGYMGHFCVVVMQPHRRIYQ